MKTTIAIDPGANGGIAADFGGKSSACYAMPDTEGDLVELLADLIKTAKIEPECVIGVFLENIVRHMGSGIPASTMAVYASNWGFIKGVVMALGVRLELVTPQSWQKKLGLGTSRGMKKGDWKNKLKAEAQRRFPHLKVTLKTADALLILEACK